MRAPTLKIALFFVIFCVLIFPLPVAADSFLILPSLWNRPSIAIAPYGTFQTAFKTGDKEIILHVLAQSQDLSITMDASPLGVASTSFAFTRLPGMSYSPILGPVYNYVTNPFTIGITTDGLKQLLITATTPYGQQSTATILLLIDSTPPTVSLTDVEFSSNSPKKFDTIYLSGSASGTGSILNGILYQMLLDADGKVLPRGYTSTIEANNMRALKDVAASSTDGTFTHVPIRLFWGSDGSTIDLASSLRIDIEVYDEAGAIATTTLTVPLPHLPPPDPCATPGACVSNALFLPGLEASRLYRPDSNGGTDQLWEPNTDSDTQDLFLMADGKSVRNDVYTKDVLDEKNVLPLGQGNVYKSFIAQMDELKTAGTINDWEAAPYDWRLSLDAILNSGNQLPDGRLYYSGSLAATSSPYIVQELRRLAKGSKTNKVTIVAHSNGGLVAKALTEKLGTEAAALIDKIIFVAVPQVGTPQAAGAILHGYDQGLPFDFLPLVLTPETARQFALNMPSAYNLLPSANYFTRVATPIATFDDSDFLAEFRSRYGSAIQDGAQLRNFITDTWRLASSSPNDLKYPSVGNALLLSQAETVHSTFDAWIPPQGVSFYEIAGWGEDTLATIEYYKGGKASCSNPLNIFSCSIVPTIMYNPKEVVDGDGTVLVPSALWSTASTTKKYWVNLSEYDSAVRLERKHADILEVPSLRTLIQNILTNSTSTTPLSFITTTQPFTDAAADKRLRFVLHSPLYLSATDSLGNTVSFATSTIPGSRFKRYGEVQVLTVPKDTPLTLSLDGYATGSFTLDMQEVDGSNAVTASSTFSAIPSATSTKASISFTDGTIRNASPLLLDYDGNGTTDFSFQSKVGKETVFDITPPEAILTFDPISQMLKISGTDNLSSTTVRTTATSTVIADESGNTLQIVFKKLKQEKKEFKLEIQELRYNGAPAGTIPKTVLQYEWSTDKTGKLRELEEKATIGSLTVEGHYDTKKNATRIKEKVRGKEDKDEKESKKILPGLVLIKLSTEEGKIGMSY